MPIGTVKNWNDLRGFGFIQPDSGGKPVEPAVAPEPLPSASRSRDALRSRDREPR